MVKDEGRDYFYSEQTNKCSAGVSIAEWKTMSSRERENEKLLAAKRY